MSNKVTLRSEMFNRKTCLSILRNEVTWGIIAILCCAVSLVIIWATNRPIDWQKYKDSAHEQGLIAIIGGIFALVATFMSFTQIIQHLRHKTHPQSQKRIMCIISMVPFYAITSWISLEYFVSAIYMELLQSCFEAYVIYCFLLLLTKFLGGHRGVEQIIFRREKIRLLFPFCCIKPGSHSKWVWYFKIGLLQFAWLNPICSTIAVILNVTNLYGNGQWNFHQGYPYLTIIRNLSQALALYSLITFYGNAKEELRPFKPLPKFIAIKLIVFFIFWQGVLMSVLAKMGVLRNTKCDHTIDKDCHGSITGFTIEEEKILLSNILICVEMFFFAIAHHWIFGWKQYADGSFKNLMESRFQQLNDNNEDNEPDFYISWV